MTRPFYKNLTVQVLTAIALGMVIGHFRPDWGQALQPLGDGFIRLVKMVVGPIVFLTIVVGIGSMGDLKKVGRVGGKAILYFEIVTTLALGVGLLVANLLRPGEGITPPSTTVAQHDAGTTVSKSSEPDSHAEEIDRFKRQAQEHSFVDFVLNVIPENVVGAFARGDLLQILFFAVLFGLALASLGIGKDQGLMVSLEQLTEVMFRVVGMIMKVAPLGGFRRHGLYDRQVRHRLARAAGQADGLRLSDHGPVHFRRAGGHVPTVWFQSLAHTWSSSAKKFCWCWARAPRSRPCRA